MKNVLISDTHFGVKANSQVWLESQMRFFYEQFIPHLKKLKAAGEQFQIIHLGDVFDSRSILNVLVANKVYKLFKDLTEICPVQIIAGNHDFYSPNSDEVNSIEVVLRDLRGDNLFICDKLSTGDKHCNVMLIPWYQWTYEGVKDAVDAAAKNGIAHFFAHTDLEHIDPEIYKLLKDKTVYSGHIHIPSVVGQNNELITLGSTFALNFADANSERGYYILDGEQLTFYPNTKSIKFHRLYINDRFSLEDYELNGYSENDYFEFYVDKSKMAQDAVQDTLKAFQSTHRNSTVIVIDEEKRAQKIPQNASKDMAEICKEMIPEHLQEKFSKVIDTL